MQAECNNTFSERESAGKRSYKKGKRFSDFKTLNLISRFRWGLMSFLSHFLNPSIFIAVLGTIQIHKLLFNMTRNGDVNSEYQEHVKEKDPYISSQVILLVQAVLHLQF